MTEQPSPLKIPPWDARCLHCGGWVGTVPGGTPWFRGRCTNRQCRMYGKTQKFTASSTA